MGEFPPLAAPATQGVTPLGIDAFLEALYGPAATGVLPGIALAAFEPPRLLTLDVRSPAEFAAGHIPGAVNIPLFSDEDRAAVGLAYSQKGKYEAIRLGLARTGPRFCHMVDALGDHGAQPGDSVLMYCWRGGMRSGSMAWLFTLCGFSVRTLEGGYRSFRRWCKGMVGNSHARAPAPVMVLGGCTGVGKTAVLLELHRLGEQVLDLEALANHRGSAFGAMGQAPQPTNEAYENTLAVAVRRVDPSRPLWLEHEGTHVGKVLTPFGVSAWVQGAPNGAMVLLEMRKELRVQRLVADYCSEENLKASGWVQGLKECISVGLAKKLGGQRVKEAVKLLDEGKWSEVAEMMLGYYDKLYTRWMSQSGSSSVLTVECCTADAEANAALVLQSVAGHGEGAGAVGKDLELVPGLRPELGGGALGSKEPRATGTCFCGELRLTCVGEPRSVSYCHCSICRRLSGAAFSCQALFAAEQVQLTFEPGAGLTSLRTSRGVERSRCASCLSPVQASLLGGKLMAVPLGLLADWRGPGEAPKAHAAEAAEAQAEAAEKRQCAPPSTRACRRAPREALPRGLLRPQHHLYYGDRVMDVADGLPKFIGSFVRSEGADSTGAGLLQQAEW